MLYAQNDGQASWGRSETTWPDHAKVWANTCFQLDLFRSIAVSTFFVLRDFTPEQVLSVALEGFWRHLLQLSPCPFVSSVSWHASESLRVAGRMSLACIKKQVSNPPSLSFQTLSAVGHSFAYLCFTPRVYRGLSLWLGQSQMLRTMVGFLESGVLEFHAVLQIYLGMREEETSTRTGQH